MTAVVSDMTLRWRLREFMSRHRITNKELGDILDRHETSISRLKKDQMPRLNGKELNAICDGLTKALSEKGVEHEVSHLDLFEFEPSKRAS